MITAIFATGRRGEFGNKDGTLPWGSIPEELQVFFDTVDSLNPKALIVGAHTWLTLPKSAKKKLTEVRPAVGKNNINTVYIFDPKGVAKAILGEKVDELYHCMFITTITPTLFSVFENTHAIAIGGAYLLDKLYSNDLVDRAFISIVKPAEGEPEFTADVKLPSTVYLADSKTTIIKTNVEHLYPLTQSKVTFEQELRIYK